MSPKAFSILNDEFVQRFYEDNDFKKYKDFRLLAIDGSCMEVPNSEELRKYYGYATNSNSQKEVARARSSTIYDVENKIVISSLLGRYDDSERELAIKNIDKLKDFDQREIKDLILFDRGYPSLGFIIYLNKIGIKYVMRTATSFYEEVTDTKTQDENVEIVVTKERAKGFKKRGRLIPVGTVIKLRVLKVMLDTGEIETFACADFMNGKNKEIDNHDEDKKKDEKKILEIIYSHRRIYDQWKSQTLSEEEIKITQFTEPQYLFHTGAANKIRNRNKVIDLK